MFRGDAAHTGVYRADVGRELTGMQWRFETGGGVVSSPVIRNDTVWVGSSDGSLSALTLPRGELVWRQMLSAPIASSPAVTADVVIAGTRDGRFHALDARTGALRWAVETGRDLPLPWGHESGDRYTASPTVAGELVVLAAGDGTVRALDWSSGKERWTVSTGTRLRSSPAVSDGRVYVGGIDGKLHAFGLTDGARLWAYETEGTTLESGQWGFDRRTIQSSPAVRNGLVYFGARDGFLYAVRADSGTLRWRFDHKISWIISSPAVTDSVVYAGSSDGQFVHAVDAATGAERWRRTLGGIVWSSPAVSGNLLLVGDGRGRLHALDRFTGDSLWTFVTAGQVFSSPVPAGRTVVVGSQDGAVYALCTDNGTRVHRAVYAGRGGTPGDSAAGVLTRTLAARGYTALTDPQLIAVLTAAVGDGRPATVVFAGDYLPPEVVAGSPRSQSLLRRFLDAGGKAVWVGIPPLLWPRDSTGERIRSLAAITWEDPAELLGVSHAVTIFDRRSAGATDAGRRWGLSGRWADAWSVDPRDVSEVLALDDWGLAAAWARSFGGPPGTGFVRVSGHDPMQVYHAAEYRPLCGSGDPAIPRSGD